jgi:hypothetical protein
MKRNILFILALLTGLAGCGLRYTEHWVRRKQLEFAPCAPARFEYTGPEKDAAELRAKFIYAPGPEGNPFPCPGRVERTAPEYRIPPLKETAAAAIGAAFIDEGVQFEKKCVLEMDNGSVGVTLDGWNNDLKIGFLFVTIKDMPKGWHGGDPPKLNMYIDSREVYALMRAPVRVLLVSSEDERFFFEAGMDPSKPQPGIDRLLASRNEALERLYNAARYWIKQARSDNPE